MLRGLARLAYCKRCRNRVGYLRIPWLGWAHWQHQVRIRLAASGSQRHHHTAGDKVLPRPRWRDRKAYTSGMFRKAFDNLEKEGQ
jgi:hypothetical protein